MNILFDYNRLLRNHLYDKGQNKTIAQNLEGLIERVYMQHSVVCMINEADRKMHSGIPLFEVNIVFETGRIDGFIMEPGDVFVIDDNECKIINFRYIRNKTLNTQEGAE